MKLERIKCKPFDRAQNLCVSKSYIVGCAGQRAVILDRQLNHIHTVEGLEYVYSAQVSPDQTKLLLVSNANKFYIVDLQTFEKTRVTVKAPHNENLEGRGCWSFDGESVWIPVNRNSAPANSTLRRYPMDDLSKYEDLLANKYYIYGISRIENRGAYFITGYNRQENNRDYFIYFDGTAFQEFPLETSGNMIASTATVDIEKGVITLSSLAGCRQFSTDGKQIRTLSHPGSKAWRLILGSLEIPFPDDITKYAVSSCGKYIYLSSKSGFYLLDANTDSILASVPEKYGVQNFEELTPDTIAIATWSGVKLYKLCP